MKQYLVGILFFLLLQITLLATNDSLSAYAVRVNQAPVIDGLLSDEVWKKAKPMKSFTQYEPYNGMLPTYDTQVLILYDDEALYIGAKMYDANPDLILLQLGNRDDNINSDHITIQFDPFNNNQDAYFFQVTASNVQSDWRVQDKSYNAVWKSRTAILDDGWSVEIKIPFSAIRMPKVSKHVWKFQVTRNLRRIREFSKWKHEIKGLDNEIMQWGSLFGLENINVPLRLSLTPYLSVFGEVHHNQAEQYHYVRMTPMGGIDLKYGINESIVLDVTLLPDFSNVQSDDVIKNLSAFEINYSEHRPFFLESMDLFYLGGLFYSRRIGKTPEQYYNVHSLIEQGDVIEYNPVQTQLINAFKVTGHTHKGLSVGLMNVLTNKTEALIRTDDNQTYSLTTEPFTNYNILAFSQALKNNSSVYFINNSILRAGQYDNVNVSGAGARLYTSANTFMLSVNGSSNSAYDSDMQVQGSVGYSYNATVGKVRGNFIYNVYHLIKSADYDINDMGLLYTNDEAHNSLNLAYRFFQPFGPFLRANLQSSVSHTKRISTAKSTMAQATLSGRSTTKNHLSLWANTNLGLTETYDYYEPRTQGMFYIAPPFVSSTFGFSSDYRRPFALDGNVTLTNKSLIDNTMYSLRLAPIIRLNNHIILNYGCTYSHNSNSYGFAGKQQNQPIFGSRDVLTLENVFSGKYLIQNNLSLSLRVRHYWAQGSYHRFYNLQHDGSLYIADENTTFDDFNFNSFMVDFIFNWEFAPGSNITMVWKNSIIDEQQYIIQGFYDNLNATFGNQQNNIFSLKLLYYLDYHTIKTRLTNV